MTDNPLLNAIAEPFIASAGQNGFNGVVSSALLPIEASEETLRASLSKLIREGQITGVFSRLDLNLHIKRLPDLPIEEQLKLLADEPLEEIGLYPAASVVQQRVDLSAWRDRPFSLALLLAEPQLAFRAFDIAALERYVSDPRYIVQFNDYMGWMSIADDAFRDAQHPERDKVSLQSFGLGWDADRNPHVIVFLRYLAGMSAEHQQYWNSYLVLGDVRMSEPYYLSSIRGEFWENRSVRHAIIEEIRLIRALTEAIWGHSLFREVSEENVPIGLTSFLRPTTENFNRFVMALDKLLADSIDVNFFKNKAPLETETLRADGKIVVQKKGTLTLLEEWLLKEIIWSDTATFRKVIIRPLREVRRARQTPAHAFTKDNFSVDHHTNRKRLLWDVFNSLSNIRGTFAKHPRARLVEVPNWLDAGHVDVF